MIGVLGGPDRHRPGDAGQQLVRHFAPLPNASPGPDRFEVDPIAFAVAEAQLRRAGLTFLGFAHSHLDGITEPSDLDRRQLWPHCLQVIVAITTTDAATFRAFRRRANRVLEVLDATTTVPMAAGTESLNAAMAGTLVLFEAARQRRAS